MNKIYSLLGIGLLSAATLSSCKEDVFIEGGDELQRGESQTYVAVVTLKRELLFGESIRKKMFRLQGMFSLLRWEMLRKVPKKQSCRIRCTCLLKAR